MGYDVHITRKNNWFDEDESLNISLDEWINYVESDSEMRLDNFAQIITEQNSTIRIENDGLAVWKKYSKNQEGGNLAWFSFLNGKVTVKNPDNEILRKMFQIALKLEGKVQGDEGELYDNNGLQIVSEEVSHVKKSWWKFW